MIQRPKFFVHLQQNCFGIKLKESQLNVLALFLDQSIIENKIRR